MTDDKKNPRERELPNDAPGQRLRGPGAHAPDEEDVDWEKALSEWDDQSFQPEIAKDIVTEKPASLAGSTASRPLYRPPAAPSVIPAAKPKPSPLPLRAPEPSFHGEDRNSSTRNDSRPEIRREPSIRATRGGGLGQLFAREISVDISFEEKSATPAAAPLPSAGSEERDPFADLGLPRSPQATRPTDDEFRKESALPSPPPAPSVADYAATRWPDERPASDWLSDAAREALLARAAWLEEETRALPDKVSVGRALLACSEIVATTGDRERAHALATEARDLAPTLALAHRQARTLLPASADQSAVVGALEAEVRATAAGPARIHSTLLIAEQLQASGNGDEAVKRLEQAARGVATDVRPAIARAARALARGELTNAALRLPASGPLSPLASAIAGALRLRGVDRKDNAAEEPSPSEVAIKVRAALDKGNLNATISLVAQIGRVPELSSAASWLAASLAATRAATRPQAARWLGELADRGDADARRSLLDRALELGDQGLLARALEGDAVASAAERLIVSTLGGLPIPPNDPRLDAVAATPGMEPLAAAVAALTDTPDAESAGLRASHTAGAPEARARVRLGRLLATPGARGDLEAAALALGDACPPAARAVRLELAFRERRATEVSAAVQAWRSGADVAADERAQAALAAALIAERAGDAGRALEAFRAARAADPASEVVVRAVAALGNEDLAAGLVCMADALGFGVRAATARVEAAIRGGALSDEARAELLERAHRSAPTLPIAAFLAESAARRNANADEVLRWIRERRAASIDSVETALEGLREALLLATRDRSAAAERLLEAHRMRPDDTALRLLCERFSPDRLADSAAWREARATEATGDARTLWYLEAAFEYERTGDAESALRCSSAAATEEDSLARVARERSELMAGNVARLADELLAVAKATDDPRSKREAYERLATLDATARQDPASALLWHRAILEEELPDPEPSLRYVEQYLVGEGRDDELEPIASGIARALRGTGPGEGTAHAELAARLRMRSADGTWESARDMVELATAESDATLWSLHMLQAHAQSVDDYAGYVTTTLRLLETTSPRPSEGAALLTRTGEAAMRLGRLDESRRVLEKATMADPGDVVAWSLLAQVRQRGGDAAGAAEAYEALARSSVVAGRQIAAWHDSGRLWQDDLRNDERAIAALEAAAAIDVAYGDVFDRLATLYARRTMQAELAALIERRLEGITDPDERLAMDVRRGRALLEVGDVEGARRALEAALSERPDDAGALSAYAALCLDQRDWQRAEETLVRLARLLPGPDQQREVYLLLGELYTHNSVNLPRAEVAFKEVLRRTPDDVGTKEKLVDVYRRQNDPSRAAELQQDLVAAAPSPEEKRRRLVELAAIHENTGHDNRKAEQTLEAARREFPQDVGILRALADFYVRHKQTPAVNILLDRAGADARRALSAGRFAPNLFAVLGLVFEVRGKHDASLATQAMLAALEGRPAELRGAGDKAFDPRLDDLLAPEMLTPPLRMLLAKTGEALDAASPVDLKTLAVSPAPGDAPLVRLATTAGLTIGLGTVQVLVTGRLGPACVPVGSAPAVLLVGDALLQPDRDPVGRFLVLRALKLLRAKASALARTTPAELPVLVAAWLKSFNPTWQPQGMNPAALNAAAARVQAALPKDHDPDLDLLALEVAGALGTQATQLAAASLMWANRVALLALGRPNDAIDAIASVAGLAGGSPRDPKQRAAWLARAQEPRDIIAFGVTEAFAEARSRLGING